MSEMSVRIKSKIGIKVKRLKPVYKAERVKGPVGKAVNLRK